jgi:AcrR family transcriptional regulator
MNHLPSITPPATETPRPREREILTAIRPVFAAKGFDSASMQDLARAAGMSVGNFYRYFPSRAAIVEAIIQVDLEEVEGQFALLLAAPDPLPVLRTALHKRVHDELCSCDDATLWAEITSAALRKPEIGAVVNRMETEIVSYLTRAFALAAGLDPAQAHARFAGHARLIVLLVKASATHARLSAPEGAQLTKLIQRQIDSLLDEIAAQRPQERP